MVKKHKPISGNVVVQMGPTRLPARVLARHGRHVVVALAVEGADGSLLEEQTVSVPADSVRDAPLASAH